MSNLYSANCQWSRRPADERFESLADMLVAAQAYRDASATATFAMGKLRAIADGGEVLLAGPTGAMSRLSHWGFGQLARRIGAPADYLRGLPADLAAANIDAGLRQCDGDGRGLFFRGGDDGASLVCRSITSEKYSRIYNAEVAERLLPLAENGWRVPPARPALANQPGARPATPDDCLRFSDAGGLSIKPGDMIAPAGLYASDHDMFAFLVNEDCRIDDGSEGGLCRGVFVANSEVGAGAFKVVKFLYRSVCGNHIVWGASSVQEIKIVHRGRARFRFQAKLATELTRYAGSSTDAEIGMIGAAKRCTLGDNRAEVIDALFGRRVLPRKALESAYDLAVAEESSHAAGSPRTAWGFAQGITRLSQQESYADRRAEIDRAAGRVLALAS